MAIFFKKPTNTSKEEKELEITDPPKVAICMEHGFNNVTLKKHGYHVSIYYRGALKPLSRYFLVGMEKKMGILWHTLAYSCILWHTLAYPGILWHALVYSGIINAP